jgi:hypothetical protein
VFITYTSATSSKSFFTKPSCSSNLPIEEVSEKLSLQPKVCNATDLLMKGKDKTDLINGAK